MRLTATRTSVTSAGGSNRAVLDALYLAAGSTPTLDQRFAEDKSLVDKISSQNLITFSRTSTGTYVDSDGLIKTAAIDAPRFDHDPSTGESLGLLIEEARTNLQFPSIPATSAGAITVTANAAVAPDGTTTATFCEPNNIGSGVRSNPGNLTKNANEFYAHTFFFKPNGYNVAGIDYGSGNPDNYAEAWIDVTNNQSFVVNTFNSVTSTSLANGWYKITAIQEIVASGTTPSWGKVLSCRPNVPTGGGQSYTRVPGAGGFFWGHQEELGSFSTSYIPTTSSTITRAADVASITGTNFSSWYNQSEGTVFVDFQTYGTSTQQIIALTAGVSNNARWGVWNNQLYMDQSGSQYFASLSPNTSPTKTTFAVASNDAIGASNGSLTAQDTTVILPTPDNASIGRTAASQDLLNGHISRLAYFSTRRTDQQLINMTS